jgi:hypothetical protein
MLFCLVVFPEKYAKKKTEKNFDSAEIKLNFNGNFSHSKQAQS